MRRVIIVAASFALVVGAADAASAKTSKHKGYGSAHNGFVQRDVGLTYQPAYRPNADYKYGPQPDYPQSPPGGGY